MTSKKEEEEKADGLDALLNPLKPKPIRQRVSRYLPHQGKRECARRLRQLEKQGIVLPLEGDR